MPAPSSKGLGQERGFAITALIPIAIGVLGSLVIIAIAVAIASSFGGQSSDPCAGGSSSNPSAQDIIKVAASQIGQYSMNGNKFQQFAGIGNASWCAAFANWVYNQVGINLGDNGQHLASTYHIYKWAQKNGWNIHLDPRPGDIFLIMYVHGEVPYYKNPGNAHTGIVVAPAGNGRYSTIEFHGGGVNNFNRKVLKNEHYGSDGLPMSTFFISPPNRGSNGQGSAGQGGYSGSSTDPKVDTTGLKIPYQDYIDKTANLTDPDAKVQDLWGRPDYIVLHYTGDGTSAANVVHNNFEPSMTGNINERFGKPHAIYVQYIVDRNPDGAIHQLLPETFAVHGTLGFHTTESMPGGGGIAVNIENVGCFECGNNLDFTQKQVDSDVALVKYLMKKWGIPKTHVVGHMEVTGLVNGKLKHSGNKDPGNQFLNAVRGKLPDSLGSGTVSSLGSSPGAATSDKSLLSATSDCAGKSSGSTGGVGSGGAVAGSAPTGSAKVLAQQLIASGKLSAPGYEKYLQQIKQTANGNYKDNVNPMVLKVLLAIIQNGHSVSISTLNRHSTGDMSGAGSTSFHYRSGGGHAVDITLLDGKKVTGRNAPSLTIIKIIADPANPLLPPGSGIGQRGCPGGQTPPLPRGVSTFGDTCNHLHVQVPIKMAKDS